MLKFTIFKGEVVVDINSMSLPIFREIYAYDTKKNKRLAHNMLYFVYLMSDLRPSNPVRDFPEDEKEEEARMASFGKANYKLDQEGEELLDKGIEAYDKHTVTSQERMLEQYDKSIDKARLLMANISEMTQNSKGEYVLDENYTKFMKEVLQSNKMMGAERANLLKEILDGGSGKVRAGRVSSHIEKMDTKKKSNFNRK